MNEISMFHISGLRCFFLLVSGCPQLVWFTIDENWIFSQLFFLDTLGQSPQKSKRQNSQPSISRNSWPCPSWVMRDDSRFINATSIYEPCSRSRRGEKNGEKERSLTVGSPVCLVRFSSHLAFAECLVHFSRCLFQHFFHVLPSPMSKVKPI